MDIVEAEPREAIVGDGFGPPPFDEASTGDCILQSNDGTRFKAHRVVLALASPVFRDMWEVGNDDQDVPVVTLTETTEVVHALLTHLYPASTPVIRTHSLVFDLLDAFDKYIIETRSLLPYIWRLVGNICDFGRSTQHAMEMYALAWRLNVRGSAELAGRYLHSVDLNDTAVQEKIIQRTGDVQALLALWDLRHRRELALDDFMDRLPLHLYRCPEHLKLSIEETGRLRQNARMVLTAAYPGHGVRESFSGALNLFDVFDVPSEASRPASVQRSNGDRRLGSIGGPHRNGAPPCPHCQGVLAETRRKNNDVESHIAVAARTVPHEVKWPHEKPCADLFGVDTLDH